MGIYPNTHVLGIIFPPMFILWLVQLIFGLWPGALAIKSMITGSVLK